MRPVTAVKMHLDGYNAFTQVCLNVQDRPTNRHRVIKPGGYWLLQAKRVKRRKPTSGNWSSVVTVSYWLKSVGFGSVLS